MPRRFIFLMLFIIADLLAHDYLFCQVSFSYQSRYTFLKGIEATTLTPAWKLPDFDDTAWHTGNAPFRYGDGVMGVELTDMSGNYSSIYLRSGFNCINASGIEKVTFMIDYDDGFVLWINGIEILRKNAPATLSAGAVATANHESGTGEIFIIDASVFNLQNGVNIIAVQAFNVSLSSSDFYFDMAIDAEQSIPEYPVPMSVDFSAPSGFYSSPFTLQMTLPDTSATLFYTLDGTNPRSSSTRISVKTPCFISIDPDSRAGRDLTPAVIIRASSYMEGYNPSFPESRTYIFIDKVKEQVAPGGSWPSTDINGQLIDLEMDREITESSPYSGLIDQSFTCLPVISIITSNKNLFDPSEGIYVNAEGHGINWERECSAELFGTAVTSGFMINAGLRIRGGYSRHDGYPKHAFRLYFREKYGAAKLNFPLFGTEGTAEFDKIDLRAEQNYGWNNGSPYNSLVREVFSRDIQREMGQPYTRSRYYHLYLNGMYWGIYMTQERSEANYAEAYFGDDDEDYDVVKVNTENGAYTIEAPDGNLDSWQRLWNMCNTGFETDSNYFKIEGKNENGIQVKGGEVMVDIDNLIDYMMVIFYTGNFDGPTSSFLKNKSPNNFFAIDNRNDKSKGFVFFAHDAEHSMFDEPHSPGVGISEDRVNIGLRTDDRKMEVITFAKFHPQWLHYKLSFNEEYRMRFKDRAYTHLQPDGVFSPSACLELINDRISEVEGAIIAESARWGDGKRPTGLPYTKNDWLKEINKIRNNFLPHRNSILLNQLKNAGLYPVFDAPVIKINSNIISSGSVDVKSNPGARIELTNQNIGGTIVYSIDGKDPRRPGGGISSTALFSANPVSMSLNTSMFFMTRLYLDGKWSAMRQVNIIMDQTDYSDLKITEIHYHPPDYITSGDTISGKDLEFIEFKNTGRGAVNLSGIVIDSAVHYQFPENKLLPPGQFYVIASKPSRFYNFYGKTASGNFSGNLSNSGEEILIKGEGGNEIMRFTYSDSSPWPSKADGDGYSLSSADVNPDGDPGNYSYWTNSDRPDGNPFADNLVNSSDDESPVTAGKLFAFPNPGSGLFQVRYDSPGKPDQIVVGLTDVTGRLILRTNITNPGILNLYDLHLPAGVYFLITPETGMLSALKIIIM